MLVMDDDVVFHRVLFQLGHDLQGVRSIDGKHTEKHADEEGKRQIAAEPVQRAENVRMDKEIINRAENSPEQGKFRANNAVDIPPLVGVIPQAHLVDLQGKIARDVLDDGHQDGHREEKHRLIDHIVFE